MRDLIVLGLILVGCSSCQEDIDCTVQYRTKYYKPELAYFVGLDQAHRKTLSPYTDISYTYSSHCHEELEDLIEWLDFPLSHEPQIYQAESRWHLDGVSAFIPSDTNHLKWHYDNLDYYGERTDCRLEKWSLGDIYDYSSYPDLYLDTVKAIAHHNRLSSGAVGIAAKRPQQFNRRYWLLNRLTSDELLSLIDFPNTVVKAVAFEGLHRRRYPGLFQILLHFLTLEQEYLVNSSGCIGRRLHLSQYCFSWVMGYSSKHAPPFPPNPYYFAALTAAEQEIIAQHLEKYGPYW